MAGPNDLTPLEAEFSACLVTDVFEEFWLVRAEEEFFFEKEKIGDN